MDTTLLIEADGQPSVTITIAADPDITFEDTGVQGPPGPAPESGDGIAVIGSVVNVNISSLTLAP